MTCMTYDCMAKDSDVGVCGYETGLRDMRATLCRDC